QRQSMAIQLAMALQDQFVQLLDQRQAVTALARQRILVAQAPVLFGKTGQCLAGGVAICFFVLQHPKRLLERQPFTTVTCLELLLLHGASPPSRKRACDSARSSACSGVSSG